MAWITQNSTNFNIDYTDLNKNEYNNIVTVTAKEQLNVKYSNFLQVFTDGSILDSSDVGAGFAIPSLNVRKAFYLGIGLSIFTAELFALIMALNFILDFSKDLLNVVFCIDSKSVLYALRNWKCKTRREMIFESRYLIHCLQARGIQIDFFLVGCLPIVKLLAMSMQIKWQ